MLAIDASGSMNMSHFVGCEQLTPAVASMALAMVTLQIEDDCRQMAFGGELEDISENLNKDINITEAIKVGQSVN